MKLRDILKEVSDETIIKYKDADGETKEMPAKSAKTMPMDHPAKKAWDVEKAKEDGGADKKEPEAGQVSFDRTAGEDDTTKGKDDSTPGPDASAATTLPTSSPGDNPYAAAEAVQAAAEKDPRDFKSLPAEEIEGRLQRMLDPLAYMSDDIIVGDEVEYDGEERGGNPIFTRYEVGGKAQKIIVDRETGELYKLTGSKKGFNKKKPLYDYRKVDGKTQLVVQNIDPRAKPRFVDEETFEISENRMNMKLSSILKEVSDETIIKYRDDDGESKEMKAGSAKTMPMDHPAKKAWDAETKKEKSGGKDSVEINIDASDFKRKARKTSAGGRGLTTQRGLEDIVKGNATEIEGIPLSKDLADGIQTWIRMSPYGKKYGKFINKGKFGSLIRPANAFGVDRYLSPKAKKEFSAIYKSMKESVSSKLTDLVYEGKFDVVDDKWKDKLDDLSEKDFNPENLVKLAKKMKINPKLALGYAFDAYGWMKNMRGYSYQPSTGKVSKN